MLKWTASFMNINRERERDGGRYVPLLSLGVSQVMEKLTVSFRDSNVYTREAEILDHPETGTHTHTHTHTFRALSLCETAECMAFKSHSRWIRCYAHTHSHMHAHKHRGAANREDDSKLGRFPHTLGPQRLILLMKR